MKIKRIILLCSVILLPFAGLKAQVTIGSGETPDKDALLDLKQTPTGLSQKGLLLPRVELSNRNLPNPLSQHVAGMIVYNIKTINDVTVGYYYNDGTQWIRLGQTTATPDFFYMPCIVLPTDTDDAAYNQATNEFTIDLYYNYATQFGLTDGSTSTKNSGAAGLPVSASNALDYFIIYYDNTVFTSVSVSDAGLLTYKLADQYSITDKTYMNIVFKAK